VAKNARKLLQAYITFLILSSWNIYFSYIFYLLYCIYYFFAPKRINPPFLYKPLKGNLFTTVEFSAVINYAKIMLIIVLFVLGRVAQHWWQHKAFDWSTWWCLLLQASQRSCVLCKVCTMRLTPNSLITIDALECILCAADARYVCDS